MPEIIGFGTLNVDIAYVVPSKLLTKLGGESGTKKEGDMVASTSEEFHNLLKGTPPFSRSPGGSAANAIVALSRMGFDTGYIGKVGKDKEGEFLLENLRTEHVDTRPIHTTDQVRSGVMFALQTPENKDRSMFGFPGANNTIIPAEINGGYINTAQILHCSSFSSDQSFNTQVAAIEKLSPEVNLSIDPGKYSRRGIKAVRPMFRNAMIIFPSDEEAATLTKTDNYEESARILLETGPEIVCITLAEKGAYIATKEQQFMVPPEAIVPQEEIVDTIGAGDVFAASFLAGLHNRKPLQECAVFANRMAAKSITGAGREQYPTREDYNAFFDTAR